MSERVVRGAPVAFVVALAVMIVVPLEVELSTPESDAADALVAALDDMPSDASVLVGFDPDIGTYAEIRPTVRTLLADLLRRGATATLVSMTPEGRALALAELERGRRLGDEGALVDRGFIPGSEAALVRIAAAIETPQADGSSSPMALDLDRPDLIVIVGGNDLGPRSWIEQVLPRIDPVPAVAVTPTALLPEVEPYRDSGQLAGLLSTPRDGATYRRDADLGSQSSVGDVAGGPSGLAVLLGTVVAIAWLGGMLVRRLGNGLAVRAERERP
jgi:hypothetical protein